MTEPQSEGLSTHRLALARELLDDVELGRVTPETLLLKASRLARVLEAVHEQEWLTLELSGYPLQALTPAAIDNAERVGRLTDREKLTGYWQPFAGLLAWARAYEAEIAALKIPDVHFAPSSANPNEWVVGFTGQHVAAATAPSREVLQRLSRLTADIATTRGIVSKITARLHEFVSTAYYELAFRGVAEGIFEAHKRQVDALLARTAGEALEKIPAIAERLSAGDPEAISHAMTTGRRVMVAFADAVQPPSAEKLLYGDQLIEAGPEHSMNRLRYFLKQGCKSGKREKRLRQTLVNLYERFNAGTHANVTPDEARALFVELYVSLGELLSCVAPPIKGHDARG